MVGRKSYLQHFCFPVFAAVAALTIVLASNSASAQASDERSVL